MPDCLNSVSCAATAVSSLVRELPASDARLLELWEKLAAYDREIIAREDAAVEFDCRMRDVIPTPEICRFSAMTIDAALAAHGKPIACPFYLARDARRTLEENPYAFGFGMPVEEKRRIIDTWSHQAEQAYLDAGQFDDEPGERLAEISDEIMAEIEATDAASMVGVAVKIRYANWKQHTEAADDGRKYDDTPIIAALREVERLAGLPETPETAYLSYTVHNRGGGRVSVHRPHSECAVAIASSSPDGWTASLGGVGQSDAAKHFPNPLDAVAALLDPTHRPALERGFLGHLSMTADYLEAPT